MSNSTHGNDASQQPYNQAANARSAQRTSGIKAVEATQNGNQNQRLRQTGPLSSGKD